MLKISSSNVKGIIIKYIFKIIISSVLSVLIFSSISSFIILKLDLPLEYAEYFSIGVCALSSIVISYISIIGAKYNKLALALISITPLLMFSVINFCVKGDNFIVLTVKIILIVLSAFFVTYIKIRKK